VPEIQDVVGPKRIEHTPPLSSVGVHKCGCAFCNTSKPIVSSIFGLASVIILHYCCWLSLFCLSPSALPFDDSVKKITRWLTQQTPYSKRAWVGCSLPLSWMICRRVLMTRSYWRTASSARNLTMTQKEIAQMFCLSVTSLNLLHQPKLRIRLETYYGEDASHVEK